MWTHDVDTTVTVDLVVLTISRRRPLRPDDPAREPPYKGRWRCRAASSVRTRTWPRPRRANWPRRPRSALRRTAGHVRGARRDPRARVSPSPTWRWPRPFDAASRTDAADARWLPRRRAALSRLASITTRFLLDGLERGGAKLEYTPLGTAFCAGGIHRRRAAPRLRDRLGHHARPPATSTAKSTGTAAYWNRPAAQRPATGTPSSAVPTRWDRTAVSPLLRDGANSVTSSVMRGALAVVDTYPVRVKRCSSDYDSSARMSS